MNILLNAPIPALAARQEYDNKILYIFVIFMSVLVLLGLVFVNLSKEFSNQVPSVTNQEQQPSLLT